jgi:hypothetical protein
MQIEERTQESLRSVFKAARLETVKSEDVLEALQAEGIESYERLVDELIRAARRAGTPPQRLGLEVLARETSPQLVERIVHRVPQVPLTVDGIAIEPQEISRFDGQALDFVAGDGSLAAFTDRRLISTWLQISIIGRIAARGKRQKSDVLDISPYDLEQAGGAAAGGSIKPAADPPNSGGPVNPPPGGWRGSGGDSGFNSPPGPTGGAPWTANFVLYQDIRWGGSQLGLQSGEGYNDLTEVSNGLFSDWNDEASSVSYSELWGVCGENINFDGSRLVIPNHTPYIDLSGIGWNDRISSVYAG